MLDTQATSASKTAWTLNRRCVHALACWLQTPGQRWQDAHLHAWVEWAAAWDPDENALDFAVILVDELRLNLEPSNDELLQLSVMFWFSSAREVLNAGDEQHEVAGSEHLEVVVDNEPAATNRDPLIFLVKEHPEPEH